jgi:non-ribosomal peptide synthetase component F
MKNINSKSIENILALTPMQEGMLFHYLKAPRGELFFEQLSLEISGEISVDHFEKAWNSVTANNEMLRTVFHWEKLEKPVQISLKEHQCSVIFYDLSDKESGRKKRALEEIKNKDRHEAFDLHRVPFRVILCKLAEKQYEVIISNHHILFDGWSTGIILREFFQAYRESSKGVIFSPPAKPAFKEFVKWIRTQDTVKQEEYWNEYLKGPGPGPDRAVTRKRKKRKELKNTADYKFKFPGELKTKLDVFIKGHHITTASFLYGVWGVLLQNYHCSDDIVFDATVSGRSACTAIKGIENLVGLFINTLPMRVQTAADETAADFLSRMYRMVQEWAKFENSSPPRVREYLDKYRSENLFDSLVVIENYPLDSLTVKETAPLSIHSFSIVERTLYDLTVIITTLDGIEFTITYNNDLFDQTVISRLSNHLVSIVEEMVTHPDRALSEIDIWVGEERETFLALIRTSRETEPEEVEIDYTAPRDKVEEKLAAIWSGILNIDRDAIGIDHNFFDFGGHSLNALLLVNAMHKELQVKIPLSEIFSSPTPRELAAFIARKIGSDEKYESIEPAEEKEYYALSSAQIRLYMLQRLDPGSTVYNGTTAVTAAGPLDKNRAERCFNTLIRRHESLGASFLEIQGQPVQKIHKGVHFLMEYIEYSDISGIEAGINAFVRPFDLSAAPLVRAGLIKIEEYRHILMVDMHHIITDGVSEAIIIKEFTALYRGDSPAPPRIQYKDFSQWQHSRLESGKLLQQESFWLHYLSGPLPVLHMPLDYSRPAVLSFEGDTVHFRVGKPVCDGLNRLMRTAGATLFMVLLSLYYILLNKYTGQQDIIIGSVTGGRDHADLAHIVGLLVETVVIRNYPAADKPFSTFLKEVKKNTLNAFENQGYPFRELTKKLGIDIGAQRNPLFDVMLIVQNYGLTKLEIKGLTFSPYAIEKKLSKLDLCLEAWETPGAVDFELEYSTRLYKRETMERFSRHFISIMETAVENPGILLADIEMLSPTERIHLVQPDNTNKLEAEFEF